MNEILNQTQIESDKELAMAKKSSIKKVKPQKPGTQAAGGDGAGDPGGCIPIR